jgi:hypothetical protein
MPLNALRESKKKMVFFETILIGKQAPNTQSYKCFAIDFRASVYHASGWPSPRTESLTEPVYNNLVLLGEG